MIKITVPHDNAVALRAFAKALHEIADARVSSKSPRDEPTSIVVPLPPPIHADTYGVQIDTCSTARSEEEIYDSRIHSDTKAKNGDGTWRTRRKPKDMEQEEWSTYVEGVKDELTQLMNIPVVETVPVPPPSEVVNSNNIVETFPQLMMWLTSRHGQLTVEQITTVAVNNGLTSLPQLAQRPDLIPQVVAQLRDMLKCQ